MSIFRKKTETVIMEQLRKEDELEMKRIPEDFLLKIYSRKRKFSNSIVKKTDVFEDSKSHYFYYPFAGVYDILGDEQKEFVRGLSEIFDLDIVEEDESHIRIVFTEKNYAYHTPEEMQKTYADFVALMNHMQKQINMVPVHNEETFSRYPNNEKNIKTNNWLKMHHMPMRRTVPKKYRRNKILATLPLNVLLIGTSGTGKSRRFVLPSIVETE